MQSFGRPALGSNASIGTFYNARNDTFCAETLFNSHEQQKAITHREVKDEDLQVCLGDSYTEKFRTLGVGPDLAASILTELVTPNELCPYFTDQEFSTCSLQASICRILVTSRAKLDLAKHQAISNAILTMTNGDVTHIVAEIDYGAQSIINLYRWLQKDGRATMQEEHEFLSIVEALTYAINDPDPNSHQAIQNPDLIMGCDMIMGTRHVVLNTVEQAIQFMKLMPMQIELEPAGQGKPISYKLLPVQVLSMFGCIDIQEDLGLSMPGLDCMKRFVHICDEFKETKLSFHRMWLFASRNKYYSTTEQLQMTKEHWKNVEADERQFRKAFGEVLRSVRLGSDEPDQLWHMLDQATDYLQGLTAISQAIREHEQKIDFVSSTSHAGAVYIGFNSLDLHLQLKKRGPADSIVFFFSTSAMQHQESWELNKAMMLKLIEEQKESYLFITVDCDAFGMSLDRSTISKYYNEEEIIHDVRGQEQYLSDHCLAKRQKMTLEEKDVQQPLKRCHVKIPCPGPNCAGTVHEWRCFECFAELEYGCMDQYVYCQCGRTPYKDFKFRCNDSTTHGSAFSAYDDDQLHALLQSLDSSDYLNILILGETGVGKSTFINAFVNYIHFETLDDALAYKDLEFVIPCSFSIQTVDRSKAENDIVERRIELGNESDEFDGSRGTSATQKTKVHPITRSGKTFRLIDTPGIGDTRGLDFDKRNMEDILKAVSAYDHLHGILILLRPNNARLTAQFSFCLKELLTHLHRDATNNVAFGFTNTRVSHYTPGDTLGPLQTLLAERKDIGLSVHAQNTYCFDSESFRFLAAAKKGILLDNKPDFDSSWKKSKSEAELMLKYFESKPPHPVKSTVSLNGTRKMILELVKPMTEITQLIRTNITLSEQDVKELKDHKLTGAKLSAKLHPEKQLLRKKDTARPRTVCTESSCVQYKDDGTNSQLMLADYPNPCHNPCYLDNVTADVRAHPNLINCAAFNRHENCLMCGHHWTMHMHILYELEMYLEQVLDYSVQKLINEHAGETVTKNAAIRSRKELIKAYQEEHSEVQHAAATFGVWMKANSIIPYNDATVAYLEVLIKAEQAKVDAGGIANKKVLADLQNDLQKHEELVRVLNDSMKDSSQPQVLSQADIQATVERLYSLKHFGENLKALKIINTEEQERTNRETPHRMDTKYTTKVQVQTYVSRKAESRFTQHSNTPVSQHDYPSYSSFFYPQAPDAHCGCRLQTERGLPDFRTSQPNVHFDPNTATREHEPSQPHRYSSSQPSRAAKGFWSRLKPWK